MVFAHLEVCFLSRACSCSAAYFAKPTHYQLSYSFSPPFSPSSISEQFVSSFVQPVQYLRVPNSLPQWIQTNNGYSYNHRVESVKGGDTMHSGKLPTAALLRCVSS